MLALEKDSGTALLFFGLFVALLYVATERVSWLVIGGTLAAVGTFAIVDGAPHSRARFVVWQHARSRCVRCPIRFLSAGSGPLRHGVRRPVRHGIRGGLPHQMSFAANSDFIVASFGEEIGKRKALGISQYGKPLLTSCDDGRDPLREALDESLTSASPCEMYCHLLTDFRPILAVKLV